MKEKMARQSQAGTPRIFHSRLASPLHAGAKDSKRLSMDLRRKSSSGRSLSTGSPGTESPRSSSYYTLRKSRSQDFVTLLKSGNTTTTSRRMLDKAIRKFNLDIKMGLNLLRNEVIGDDPTGIGYFLRETKGLSKEHVGEVCVLDQAKHCDNGMLC